MSPVDPQERPNPHPHALAVCGYSGSGKTTLLVELIEALSPEHRIGYVKHDAHGFQMDRPGKDTARAVAAGAVDILINDAGRSARISARPLGLFDAAFTLLDCDWVFVEGYKHSDLPKILVLDREGRAEREWRDGRFRNVQACVGGSSPEEVPVPLFPRDDVDGITEFIRTFWREAAAAVPLYGLVLAGGGPLALDVHRLHRLHRLVSAHCDAAFLSVRPDQADEEAFDGVPRIEDRFLGLGPTGRILSAMQEHPGAAWLVVTCDLPFIDDACILRLLAHRSPFRFATAYTSPHDGLPEPLCAVYEPKSRLRLLQAVGLGHRCPRKMLMSAEIELVTNENQWRAPHTLPRDIPDTAVGPHSLPFHRPKGPQ
ncbi:MAG: molybdopterin-guanine dinucleotide biosynthesis protein B [Gemmatimonadota bacterium]